MNNADVDPVCKTLLISDEPASEDAFGGAYQRVAKGIADVIRHEDGGKTIGLEGTWGSGKSTIVNFVRHDLEQDPNFLVWIFNTQAHKGDPLRRTFIETLVQGIRPRWQLDGKKWDRELSLLAGRRRSSKSDTSTSVGGFALVLGALLALIPVGIFLLNLGFNPPKDGYPLPWLQDPTIIIGIGALLSVLGLMIVLIRSVVSRSGDGLSLFSQHSETSIQTESIETPDPTSVEFASTFQKLMRDCLDGNTRRLILVIDNLDRVERKDAQSI